MSAAAMALCGGLFQLFAKEVRAEESLSLGLLVGSLILMSLMYFAVNALLTSSVVFLKRNEPLRPLALLRDLGWVGLAYAGSASIAGLLYLTSMQFGVSVLIAAAPIIAMFLLTMHHYFNRQEADEEIRHARLEAAEREAAQAARHVHELQESERRFHSAFTHASIGMALVAFDGRVLQVNAALTRLLGMDEAQMLGRAFGEFVRAEDIQTLGAQIARVDEREIDSSAVELRCRHREGKDVWVALHCSFFSEPGVAAPCLILQAQDISARRDAEGRLQHIAFHDSLTSLPNRSRFHEHLARAIERARLSPRHQFAVMFLDFDRFKLVNDSMGHGAGDELLVQVTRRLREHVRPTDVVARLGGDEFAILCADIEREQAAVQLAERLQQALRQPLQIAGNEITTSASIGITFSGFGYQTPEEVLRDADIAMYKAKAGGKARYALFDAGLHAQVSERVRLEADLRRALAGGELSLAYQPLFNLASGRLKGFEALARWRHPERGLISPALFIPVAEESGLMLPISDFMLERACRQLRRWQNKDDAFADLRMQINVSGSDLAHGAFVDRVQRAIAEAQIRPANVTLELTENILMERFEGALETLGRMRDFGVGISVDDFGTGYSSLSCLSTLPIDSLKIDRSFVQNLRAKSKEFEIVRAIVSLGNSLGKSVIAEGIETPAQLEQLRALGCEMGQGYHLSYPLAAERAEALLDGIDSRVEPGTARVEPRAVTLLH
jgi:diguanylate cyclase (GGDEF)-like protein/PAS domain S-box-containing protein